YLLKGGRVSGWLLSWAVILVIFLIVIVIQGSYLPINPIVYVFGIRNYLGYVPLAFIMGDLMTRDDINRMLRIILNTTLPIAPLVVLQFVSSPESIFNQAIGSDTDGIFLVAEGVVRPYGPFTFVIGQSTFAVMALAVFMIVIERRKEVRLSPLMLLACGAATGCMGAVSGSRTYFVSAGLIFLAALVSAVTARGAVAAR